uniref:Uncharacterized protein n=1 Tax=Avena sativa TaxID=4498 RepID=A0ACD6AAP4_AVESA
MDTEPFDEADLALPTSPAAAASPPRRLKRLKKSSQITTTTKTAASPPPPSSPPASEEETLAPSLGSPAPPPNPSPPPPSAVETVAAPRLASPPPNPSPPPAAAAAADADAVAPAQSSPPAPISSPLPPPDTAEDGEEEEEDDGLDPLFSEYAGLAGWHPLSMPTGEEGSDEEEGPLGGGGLIEELRREKSAKKRLDMDEGEDAGGEMGAEPEVAVKGKRSKRRKKDADVEGKARKKDADVEGKKRKKEPKESAGSKKRAEKERRVQLESIHAESQRLLRETRKASFKPIAEPVYKPISSVLEKIRLRKLEILKKSNTPVEEEEEEADDASSEPENDPAEQPCVPEAKEVGSDDNDLKIDGADNEVAANVNDLNDHDSPPEDKDALTCKKDLDSCGGKSSEKELVDNSQDNHEDNPQPSDDSNIDTADETQLPRSSSPTKSTDDSSSEDEEDNDKENIYPDTQQNDVNTHRQPRRANDAILKDFLDVEAEEEDDSDDDMMRFKDDEEDNGDDENEVLTALIAAGFEEEEVDHEKRNALHQKWLQQQDAAETNNVIQKLKFGHQEQKSLLDEDEDDVEDCEDESENEMSYDLTPTNVVRQNSEKAKQMIAKMFTDENDTYEHSDDEEIEENLARQRISKREVHSTFISPLEDDSSREMFSLIKKLNIAPEPKRKGKQATSNFEMLMVGSNSNSSSKSSFLGRTTSGPVSSSHRPVYKTYVFGRDDSNSNSKSCLATSESTSDMDQTNPSQPKKAKFSSSQPKPASTGTTSGGDSSSSGASLFELLRRSSVATNKQEPSRPEGFGIITESQAVHQFSAFKLSRKFSKIGARN